MRAEFLGKFMYTTSDSEYDILGIVPREHKDTIGITQYVQPKTPFWDS